MPSSTRPCACGGTITANDVDARRLQIAVSAHRQTPQHQAWSSSIDYARGPLQRPTLEAAAEAIARAQLLVGVATFDAPTRDDPDPVITESELRLMDGNR